MTQSTLQGAPQRPHIVATLRVANIGRLLDVSKVVDATFLIKPSPDFASVLTS